MATFKILKVLSGGSLELPRNDDGSYACSEGDTIGIEIFNAKKVPSVRVEGFPSNIVSVDNAEEGSNYRYHIPIHTWAGRSQVEIDCENLKTIVELDIAPHPGKLGADAFDDMLDELEAISRELPWGISPGHVDALVDDLSPLIVQPAALEQFLPDFKGALSGLYQDPLLRSVIRREVRPLTMARRVDSGTLRWIGRRPAVAAALHSGFANMPSQDPRLTAEQPVIDTSYDHPATRYIVGLLNRLDRRMEDTRAHLKKVAEGHAEGQNNEFVRSYASGLAEKVRQVNVEVTDVLSARPFRNVKPGPLTETVVQALGDHPAYRRVHMIARQMLQPGLQRSETGDARGSLRETWDLFELLVLFRLGTRIAKEFDIGWTWTPKEPVETSLTHGLESGLAFSAKNQDGWRIEFRYQQAFRAMQTPELPDGFRSLTRERRPDYVIGIFRDEQLRSWVVLDAKYRISKMAVHEGLADVHVYRDALRWNGKPCSSAWVVVPALNDDARLYSDPTYKNQFQFGALDVSGHDWADALLVWLMQTVAH